MLPLLALMAIGAAAGAAKGEYLDKPKEARDRKLAATKEFLSPWTHVNAAPVQEHSTVGSAFQGATTAGALGQWYQDAQVPETPSDPAGYQGPTVSPPQSAPPWRDAAPNTSYDKTPSGYPLTQPAQGQAGNYTDWLAMSADGSPRAGQGRPNYVTR